MDPIAKTAYYCCGVRVLDARRERPVCGDRLAERFMDDEAQAVFARFRRFRNPNAANAVRHRIVDDLLRERLAARPELQVVLLGAGFDTRAFRLDGGRWLELDTPALIALKEQRLPARDAPNPLARVAIDFGREPHLADELAAWLRPGEPALAVLEGVTMYLGADRLRATAATLQRCMPGHTLICDLMDERFMRLYTRGVRHQIRRLGGDFAPPLADPAAFVASLGYRESAAISIAQRSAEFGVVSVPRWLLATALLRSLRDGYRVHVFESLAAAASGSAAGGA